MQALDDKALIPDRNEVNFSWLLKLRWGSIVGQIATILFVHVVLEVEIPLPPLFVVVLVESLSNLTCALWFRRKPVVQEWQLAAVMALDVVLLTLLLFFTGGPQNPFSFLYLVNIALAAVALHAQWTWMLVALSLLCFGLLPLTDYRELPLSHLTIVERQAVHQQGMWVAFGVAAGFIVHFLWRVTHALGEQQRELVAARENAARQQRLASLATMAAGAAHELATPLGTIALVAKELERSLAESAGEETLEDMRLIRAQVARCRLILDQMSGGIGGSAAQVIEPVSLPTLLQQAVTGVRESPPVFTFVDDYSRDELLQLPVQAVAQALRGLVTNAQDSCERDGQKVRVEGHVDGTMARIEVRDEGRGMTADELSRVCEPFFTTKPPGRGMGLGLFLARAVVEGVGGSLHIDSVVGEGTVVRVELPRTVDDATKRE